MKYIELNYFASSFVIFLISCNTVKTDYYFPSRFAGDVAVVYDSEGGEEVQNNKSFASKVAFFYVGGSMKLDTNRYFFENHVQNLLSSKAYH